MSRAELYQQFKILIMLKNQQKEFLKEIDRLNSSAQKCKEKVREMEDYLQKKIYKEITTFPFVFQSEKNLLVIDAENNNPALSFDLLPIPEKE